MKHDRHTASAGRGVGFPEGSKEINRCAKCDLHIAVYWYRHWFSCVASQIEVVRRDFIELFV